jgi:hypothetical protein
LDAFELPVFIIVLVEMGNVAYAHTTEGLVDCGGKIIQDIIIVGGLKILIRVRIIIIIIIIMLLMLSLFNDIISRQLAWSGQVEGSMVIDINVMKEHGINLPPQFFFLQHLLCMVA